MGTDPSQLEAPYCQPLSLRPEKKIMTDEITRANVKSPIFALSDESCSYFLTSEYGKFSFRTKFKRKSLILKRLPPANY